MLVKMGVFSNQSLRLLLVFTVIGIPWFIWLVFNWPSRNRIGIPVYFNFENNKPIFNTTFPSSYGYYDLELSLTVPTSPSNQNLGQFMINTQIISNNKVFFKSIRPALLTYTSVMSFWIRDVILCLLDLANFSRQSRVETFILGRNVLFKFAKYELTVELNNPKIQIYDSILWIRQKNITYIWLFFYICALGLYTLFCLITSIFLIRSYLQSKVHTRGKLKHRR